MLFSMSRYFVAAGVFVTLIGGALTGCATTKVTRVDAAEEVALTDKWNDTDSRLVADEMIADMLAYPWVKRFYKEHPDKEPTIVVQRIRNKSTEHISASTFVNDIKRAVLRSGKASFIVSGDERQQTRAELREQDVYASEESRMEMGQERGANFALTGTIDSIVDQLDGTRVTFYQVDLKLVNLQTTLEVWNGQKKIKKVQKRSKFGF